MKRFGVILAVCAMVFAGAAEAADSSLSAQANAAFLAAYAKKPGVFQRTSGLMYRILQSGYGQRPASTDIVNVYYKGLLINGKQFDATEPGFPAEFPVNGVIAGWTEALELMREGDHWELVIPSNLGYGTRGSGDVIPPNQTLVFDVTLVKTSPPPKKKEDDQPSQ
jgi:FKBP-type peptidyl-prolyl cis-trans isomerase FklB